MVDQPQTGGLRSSDLQYRCAAHPNRKGRCMPKSTTKPKATDWERVKREALQEAPIAHAEDDGPYDPNDAAAAAAALAAARAACSSLKLPAKVWVELEVVVLKEVD